MYVLLVVFQASMYFSMHEERQVCSFEERDVEGDGMQAAKQFLDIAISWHVAKGKESLCGERSSTS
jgi:hypothetical protein